jgi:hypothetical protein
MTFGSMASDAPRFVSDDGNHLTPAGAELAARQIFGQAADGTANDSVAEMAGYAAYFSEY